MSSSQEWKQYETLLAKEAFTQEYLQSDNLSFLQKVFEKTQDTQVMNTIVQAMVDEYQFVAARQFIETLSDTQRLQLEPSLHLKVAFNSFSLSSSSAFTTLSSLLQHYTEKKLITSDEAIWYEGLLALMEREYEHFFQLSLSFQNASYKQFASKLTTFKTQIAHQIDMPAYYFDTLVAVELFNQGYFQIAKVLALYAMTQDKSYILPYQLLAYANFLTNSWDAAVEYLTTLLSLDPAHQEKYDFLIGIAYYRNQKYEASVLKLSQVKGEEYRLDVERYLVLNYVKLRQPIKLLSTWQKILGFNQLKKSDFFTYFYEVFFVPYRQGEEYTRYAQNPQLAQQYVQVCNQLFTNDAVCAYGQVGIVLAKGDLESGETMLLRLVEEYPQGYLFHALGELYLQQGEKEKAKYYLLKSVSMSETAEETWQVKNLLQKVM
ncbi:MAG: hypothetical protein LBG59_02120 [Candidatus Peribacteria bacterium]|jgi:tetratricopeptide (TPR) repeat protein|nr:hypothetical protein [Candidatus Peribacteria bacterium]